MSPQSTMSLDELLSESQASLGLDDLLTESLIAVKEKKEVAEARKRLANGGAKFGNSSEDLTRLRDWESKNLWEAETLVACFQKSSCRHCQSQRMVFSGYFVRDTHKTDKSHSRRWVAIPETGTPELTKLPKETAYIRAEVPMCVDCMPQGGWDMENMKEIS